MNNKILIFSGAVALACLSSSCLRDDLKPCPDLDARFTVEDKLFVGDEDAPVMDAFKDYIPTLQYVLTMPTAAEPVYSSGLFDVDDSADSFNALFDGNLNFGKYNLVAWGGLADDSPLSEDLHRLQLNPSESMQDVYVANAELDFSVNNHTINANMKRVKGLLTIDSDLSYAPKGLTAAVVTLTNISSSVTDNLEYEGAETVMLTHKMSRMSVCHTEDLLPPTAAGKKTRVSMRYFDPEHPNGYDYTPDDVEIEIRRNEVTSLKYAWDGKHSFIISLLVDGRWIVIDDMKVF